MPRQKKNVVNFSMRLEKKTADKLELFCNDSGLTKTMAVQRALEKYIDDYYVQQEKLQSINQ